MQLSGGTDISLGKVHDTQPTNEEKIGKSVALFSNYPISGKLVYLARYLNIPSHRNCHQYSDFPIRRSGFPALTPVRALIYQHGQYFDREYTMLLALIRYMIIEYDLRETNSIPSWIPYVTRYTPKVGQHAQMCRCLIRRRDARILFHQRAVLY